MGGMKRMAAMKKSTIAKGPRAKVSVFKGTKAKTVGGLNKSALKKNKRGKIVSAAQSNNAKKRFVNSPLAKWAAALKKVHKAMGLKGFVACKKGTDYYKA